MFLLLVNFVSNFHVMLLFCQWKTFILSRSLANFKVTISHKFFTKTGCRRCFGNKTVTPAQVFPSAYSQNVESCLFIGFLWRAMPGVTVLCCSTVKSLNVLFINLNWPFNPLKVNPTKWSNTNTMHRRSLPSYIYICMYIYITL